MLDFLRDMALGGPYFSKFLLMSIYALAGRHSSLDSDETSMVRKGEVFMEKAKLLLLDEISSPKPKIPTIQALLILGGRQCAVGKISEGWLYTGMVCHHATRCTYFDANVAGHSNNERYRTSLES